MPYPADPPMDAETLYYHLLEYAKKFGDVSDEADELLGDASRLIAGDGES